MNAPILTIGGEPVELAPVAFATVRKLLPEIAAMGEAKTDFAFGEITIRMVALLLKQEPASIEERITYAETIAVMGQMRAVLSWIGMVPLAPGEAPATS